MSIPHELQRHPTALFSGALLVCLFAAGTLFDAMALPQDERPACVRPTKMQYAMPRFVAVREGGFHDTPEAR